MFLGPLQSLVPIENKVLYCSKTRSIKHNPESLIYMLFHIIGRKNSKEYGIQNRDHPNLSAKICGDDAYITINLCSGVRIQGSQ